MYLYFFFLSSTQLQYSKNSFLIDQLENNKLAINYKINVRSVAGEHYEFNEITHGNVSQHGRDDDHFKGNKIINIKYSIIIKQKCIHFKSIYKINTFIFDSNTKLCTNIFFLRKSSKK